MRKIELVNNKGIAVVDNEDFEKVSAVKSWSINNYGYAKRTIEGKTVYMHAFIIGKAPKGMNIDHINRNKLDNRRSNLRYLRYSDNHLNVDRVNRMSGYVGVSWNERDKRWRARIKHQGKCVYDKGFKTALEAAIAYDSVVQQYHKDFASLNFPK